MMNFHAIRLVAGREIRERVRGWSFRLSTAAVVVLAAGLIIAGDVVPGLIEQESTLGIVSGAGTPAGIEQALERSALELDEEVDAAPYPNREAAAAALRDGDIDAYLAGGELVFESDEQTSLTAVVNRAVYLARLPEVLDELGLSPEEAQPLVAPEGVTVSSLEPGDAEDRGARTAVAALAAIGLYLVLVLYGSWMLTGVAEEKSSRVVEVLLGLLRPEELLAGKTLGILGTAAIQIVCAGIGAAVGLAVTGNTDIPDLAFDMAAVTAGFFILGVLLYGLLYAAFGATVSRQTDAQTAAMPVTFLLLIPYLLSLTVVPADPDGTVAFVLGIFPLSSPLVMPSLVALDAASALEVAVAFALMFPTLAFVAWLGGRIYAGAILSNRRTPVGDLLRPGSLRRLLTR